jgi:transposase
MDQSKDCFVGIDWGSESHQVCLLDAQGRRLGQRAFAHGGAGLAEMAAWLIRTSGAEPAHIHVAIETPHGPVVEGLLERGFQVYAINPKQLDRFRDRVSPAGAKDDSRDADVLADSLRTDAYAFRRLAVDDPVVIELREFSRMAGELQAECTALANRIREQLWRYYPQFLDLADDLTADWVAELWALAPTPDKARRLRPSTLERLLKRHHVRRFDTAFALARLHAPALTLSPGTVAAASAHVRALFERLRLVLRQLKHAHHRLDELTAALMAREAEPGQSQEQRDVTILHSSPGIGRIILATLLAEASDALRRRDYHALRCLSGVAPVTRRSGKSRIVLRRYACQPRLRDAVYHWARAATQRDVKSQAKYQALRARGHSHGRALRSVADRLLAVACAMLTRQTCFDPDHAAA